MGILQTIGRAFSPQPVARRSYRGALVSSVRAFASGVVDRLTAGWKHPSQTADEEIKAALETTRNRSRDLANNNEYAKKYLQMLVANVVGPNGFTLISEVAEPRGGPDAAARQVIERHWGVWCRRGSAEITGRLSFTQLQQAVAETWARDGEALLIQVTGRQSGNDYGYALRLVEVDRLPVFYSKDLKNGNRVEMGVELDEFNRPVAYWLNMGGLSSNAIGVRLTRVPAEQVLHIFKPYRAEQVRGMPAMHAVINGLKMLDGYEEAAVVAARVGAAKMGFFTTPDGNPDAIGDDKDAHGNTITEADPGSFFSLPPGVQFQEFNPDYPHANYDSFMKRRLRGIAAGMGVTYHGLANDLEGVNYSSIRSGTLEERDAWMVLQNWFADAFLRPVFLEWLRWGLTTGAIAYENGNALPITKIDKFSAHRWQGRRWGWVDPMKDIQAARLAIQTGIASPQMIAAQNAVDVEDVLQAIAQFEQMLADNKVTLVSLSADKPAAAPQSTQQPDNSQDDDEDDMPVAA
jgi:lambda family phage portal protein